MSHTDGVKLMKPIPGLDELLDRAVAKGIFGTKMHSVIDLASPTGITAIVTQRFEIANQIIDHQPDAHRRARGVD